MLLYTPNKLINSKNEIIKRHKKVTEIHIDKHDTSLRELIDRLVSLNEDSVKREAYGLRNDEVDMIAAYLPVNFYKVDMTNLFWVFTYRAEKRYFDVFYSTWQDHFSNNECNAFMYQWLLDNDEIFGKVLDISLKGDYQKMLVRGDVLLAFGSIVKERILASDMSLEDILEPWKLRNGCALLWEMQFSLYTYCPKKVYLKISKEELLSFVKQYALKKGDFLRKYVINFVGEFELDELERFSDIGNFLLDTVGNPGTGKFSDFCRGISENIVAKFTDWLNRLIIDEVFENDERSVFWRQYRFNAVTKYERSNSVVMDMGKYYATEFLGRAMGPIYIYGRDTFDDHIKGWFKYRDNSELRSLLYSHSEYYFIRQEHKKPYGNEHYWEYKVDDILRSYNMTTKITE